MAPQITAYIQDITNEIDNSENIVVIVLINPFYNNLESTDYHTLKNEVLKIEKIGKYLKAKKKEGIIKIGSEEGPTVLHVKNGELQKII